MMGTTSACAENTGQNTSPEPMWWNYLRVRGEYHPRPLKRQNPRELPPRARRIPNIKEQEGLAVGTTSACAENTSANAVPRNATRNYLRVRGEYTNATAGLMCYGELPPRARRIHGVLPKEITTLGTTSACAENTPPPTAKAAAQWNYLRVRGEYSHCDGNDTRFLELPPRARRILQG